MIELYKNRIEKWKVDEVVQDVFAKAAFTLKILTRDLIEGNVPIFVVISNYKKNKKSELLKMLYRCQVLYEAKEDVQKIFLVYHKA